MINLLTLEEKKLVKNNYNARLGIVVLSMLTIFVFISFVFLVPSYLLSSVKESIARSKVEILKKGENFTIEKGLNETIKDINTKLAVFEDGPAELLVSKDVLDVIFASRDASIKIDRISYVKQNDKKHTVDLQGSAFSREDLLSFSKKLEQTGKFSKVDLPISNLVRARNSNFSMILTIQK